MSLKKFGQSDVIRNVMRAYPHNSFIIYSSSVYYDQRPIQSGGFNSDILSAAGGLSLFEYNVDRSGSTKFETEFVGAESTPMRTKLVTSSFLNPPIIPYTEGTYSVFLTGYSGTQVVGYPAQSPSSSYQHGRRYLLLTEHPWGDHLGWRPCPHSNHQSAAYIDPYPYLWYSPIYPHLVGPTVLIHSVAILTVYGVSPGPG